MSIVGFSINEIIGSTIAQLIQWTIIAALYFLLRIRGQHITALNSQAIQPANSLAGRGLNPVRTFISKLVNMRSGLQIPTGQVYNPLRFVVPCFWR